MDLSSDVYRELGKTFINIGQAIIIATLVAWLVAGEHSPWWLSLIAIVSGALIVILGLVVIQKAYRTKQEEERRHG